MSPVGASIGTAAIVSNRAEIAERSRGRDPARISARHTGEYLSATPAARCELSHEYLESPHALGLDEEGFLVASVLQHRVETCGDPLLWSPSAVAETMLSWFPRQVSCRLESARQLPAVMAALLSHVALKRGLGRDPLDQLLNTVAAAEDEFVESVSDRGRYGPAKSVVMAMLAEGVDIEDRRAVDAWIAAFNGRPRAQRDLVLGHLRDASSLSAETAASRTG
jgi:hypothetical protein